MTIHWCSAPCPTKSLPFFAVSEFRKKRGSVFFANLCSPTGSIVVTSCSLNINEILPNLHVLRIQGEHWREGELLLTYTKDEGELNINQKVFNCGGKTAKLQNCRNRRNPTRGVELQLTCFTDLSVQNFQLRRMTYFRKMIHSFLYHFLSNLAKESDWFLKQPEYVCSRTPSSN